jgi:amino acid adenylation domain-containing protein
MKIDQSNIEDIYPLSPMQQGMLFHSLLNPESGVYFDQISCDVRGNLNVDLFSKAWQKVVERNTILRTGFLWEELNEPLQYVLGSVPLPFEFLDWSQKSSAECEKDFIILCEEDIKSGFNLNIAPLIRIKLIKINDKEFKMLWSNHHLLFDGWGLQILLKELFYIYDCLSKNIPLKLSDPIPFKDFISWIQNQDADEAQQFWTEKLSGFTEPVRLNFGQVADRSANKIDYLLKQFLIDKKLSSDVNNYCKAQHITLNTLARGLWAVLLSKYSGEKDLVFGITVSGRSPEFRGSDEIVGLFINTIPLRVKIDESQKISDWLKNLQLDEAKLRNYEHTSLIDIQKWSGISAEVQLFDNIMVLENYPVSESFASSGRDLELSNLKFRERTNYPLTFVVTPGQKILIEIAFDTSLIDEIIVENIFKHFTHLLQTVIANSEKPVSSLNILDVKETERLLYSLNETFVDNSGDDCIHKEFEKIAALYPVKIACEDSFGSISYSELNEAANRAANYLLSKGINQEDIVTVIQNKTIDLIISILGILKAGAAYLPIDPSTPSERMNFILNDSKCRWIISDSDEYSFNSEVENKLISTSSIKKYDAVSKNPELKIFRDNLAYVIYTSGSTGKPKGTLITHRGVPNLIRLMAKDFKISADSVILQLASISFDASISEIFQALLTGAKLILTERDNAVSISDLSKIIIDKKVTHLTFPPALLEMMPYEVIENLLCIISAGDVCNWKVAEKCTRVADFYNGYGPTESTVGCAWFKVDNKYSRLTSSVPIGKPIANHKIYLLDKNLYPVPVGVVGEIYISGIGLARGYLNKPDLTGEKFIPDPFSKLNGSLMYKSGDLAYRLPDGNIVFQGRTDYQIKIRGFRIEADEISESIKEIEAVKEAVVIPIKDQNNSLQLAAFYTSSLAGISTDDIMEHLSRKLPEYMMPAFIIKVAEFPRTLSDKIDRQSLLKNNLVISSDEFQKAAGSTQELLVSIWSDVLKRDSIGINDNFFHLGGHSLLATLVVSRIRETFSIDLPLKTIFEYPKIKDLSVIIDEKLRSGISTDFYKIEKSEIKDSIPLSFSQQRLWFLDKLKPESASYNIPMAVKLKGDLNLDAFNAAINILVERHEVLRTCFREIGGKPLQFIEKNFGYNIDFYDLSEMNSEIQSENIDKIIREGIDTVFHLDTLPLIRFKNIKTKSEENILLIVSHHIISDGWSVGILIKELVESYQSIVSGKEISLQPLKIQYADYSIWQKKLIESEYYQIELDYWRKKLLGIPQRINLPTDYQYSSIHSSEGNSEKIQINSTLLDKVKILSINQSATVYMTLLAVFKLLLSRICHQSDIVIGTPVAGRTHPDLEKLIGFFVNTLALRTDLSGLPDFKEILSRVRQTSIEAFAHQFMPFEKLVEEIQPSRDLSHTPIFQVMFVFQNLPAAEMKLENISASPFAVANRYSNFELSLVISENENGLVAELEYNNHLFTPNTIRRILNSYLLIIEQVVNDPDLRIDEAELLSESEKETILFEWNKSELNYKNQITFKEHFEEIAQAYSEFPALSFVNSENELVSTLTYDQLNKKANQFAHYLISKNLKPEELVGVLMERSLEMIISILGILKAGCGFVPIDPNNPEDRLKFMIEDAGLSLITTNLKYKTKISKHSNQIFCFEEAGHKLIESDDTNPETRSFPENIAYVIYTSGSTGKPKGTLLQNEGMCNLAASQIRNFGVGPGHRILQFSSLSFDASVWEITMAMLSGSELIIADQQMITSGHQLSKLLTRHRISTVTLPPSVLAVIPFEEMNDLKNLITAGEAVNSELVKKWEKNRNFFNAYGPTETTVCASMYLCSGEASSNPPIGKPIGNFRLFVLDESLNPVPVGVPGELCVEGIGLARGYLNQPAMTAEKFSPNPFSHIKGSRLYHTGDLVKYQEDGNIEYLGRIDKQVKLRGFRIEIGEIENILKRNEKIKDAAVVVREDAPAIKNLVAYYVINNEKETTIAELKEFLAKYLPEYMIPSLFVYMQELPLTISGKIDRAALPMPKISRSDLSSQYVAPKTDSEVKIALIVSQLLGTDKVGINDNFFEMGGHSLLATQFISRMRDEFGVELPLRKIFEKPDVAGISSEIEKLLIEGTVQQIPKMTKVSREGKRIKSNELMD